MLISFQQNCPLFKVCFKYVLENINMYPYINLIRFFINIVF